MTLVFWHDSKTSFLVEKLKFNNPKTFPMPIHPFREEDKETGNSITRDGASKMRFMIQKMKEPQT